MKCTIKDFFSKWDQMVTITEEILNEKLHLLCSATVKSPDYWKALQITLNLDG